MHKIAQLRKDYAREQLDKNSVLPNPIDQFKHWMEEALSAEIQEPTAMNLATVGTDGKPSSRMVLLKGVDHGFHFFTNYESRKGRELAGSSHAALCFWWSELERQVRIEGEVEVLSRQENETYYHSRPLPSRLGAWASPQSAPLTDRNELELLVEKTKQELEDAGNPPLPPFWGGYRLLPHTIEFWQGRPSRLHDRIRYTLKDNSWAIERLAP